MRCSALLLQSITWHFFSKALLGISSPRRCFAILLFSDAMLCHSSLSRCVAQRIQRVAVHFFSGVGLRVSSPRRRTALLLQSAAVHFFSKALLCISSPKRCCAFLIRRVAGASIAAAMRLTAYPSRCFTLRFLSEAFHCFALPHFAPAKQNSANALYCFSTPQPCPATQCSSTPVLHGAYPLGPLPAPISVLSEELPDPALGIEWEPLCPGRGLAHDAPYILEVCLRSVGVPLDDHLVVDVEDHPVSGLLEVV